MMTRLLMFCVVLVAPCFATDETFLLVNGVSDEIVMQLGSTLDERVSPCSTFKIALSLMGYDAGILQDAHTPLWDFQEGYDDWLAPWKATQTPQSWMQYSCVWYSKVLALQLGIANVQRYLIALDYGNRDLSAGLTELGKDSHAGWLNSSLKISPREQVNFIQKMIRQELPIERSATAMTKKLLFKEELTEGWNLFGKTGWSGSDIGRDGKALEFAWFVGWIEKDESFFPFAYLIRGTKIDLNRRIPRAKELLSLTLFRN